MEEFLQNKRNYVQEQAVSGDQVLYELAIRNRVLVDWSRIESQANDIDLLNSIIPGGAVKINPASERMQKRLKWHSWEAQQQYKKLNQKGSKAQRNTFLLIQVENDFYSRKRRRHRLRF